MLIQAKWNNAKIKIQELILSKICFWNAKRLKWPQNDITFVDKWVSKIHEVAPEVCDLSKMAHREFEFDITVLQGSYMDSWSKKLVTLVYVSV